MKGLITWSGRYDIRLKITTSGSLLFFNPVKFHCFIDTVQAYEYFIQQAIDLCDLHFRITNMDIDAQEYV